MFSIAQFMGQFKGEERRDRPDRIADPLEDTSLKRGANAYKMQRSEIR